MQKYGILTADLHALGADDIERSRHAGDKLDDLAEAVIADAPGAVDEEDQVGLGASAHCGRNTSVMTADGQATASSLRQLRRPGVLTVQSRGDCGRWGWGGGFGWHFGRFDHCETEAQVCIRSGVLVGMTDSFLG